MLPTLAIGMSKIERPCDKRKTLPENRIAAIWFTTPSSRRQALHFPILFSESPWRQRQRISASLHLTWKAMQKNDSIKDRCWSPRRHEKRMYWQLTFGFPSSPTDWIGTAHMTQSASNAGLRLQMRKLLLNWMNTIWNIPALSLLRDDEVYRAGPSALPTVPQAAHREPRNLLPHQAACALEIVILSEAFRGLIAKGAVEGPAVRS